MKEINDTLRAIEEEREERIRNFKPKPQIIKKEKQIDIGTEVDIYPPRMPYLGYDEREIDRGRDNYLERRSNRDIDLSTGSSKRGAPYVDSNVFDRLSKDAEIKRQVQKNSNLRRRESNEEHNRSNSYSTSNPDYVENRLLEEQKIRKVSSLKQL